MTALFVSWTKQNGRTADLARALGAQTLFAQGRGPLPFRYITNALITFQQVRKRRPSVLLIMLPPTPLLLVALICRVMFRCQLAFDLHTGFFLDPKWRMLASPSLYLIRKAAAIVTNESLKAQCARMGVPAVILHDPAPINFPAVARIGEVGSSPTIVWPVSYANDEPIASFVAAARQLPRMSFVMTGVAPASLVASAPTNVTFSGWLSRSEYVALLSKASGVAALTNRAHTMQRAAYEAISIGKPVIASDFPELREFLGSSAVYSDGSVSSLAAAFERFERDLQNLSESVRNTQVQWRENTEMGLAELRANLEQNGYRVSDG